MRPRGEKSLAELIIWSSPSSNTPVRRLRSLGRAPEYPPRSSTILSQEHAGQARRNERARQRGSPKAFNKAPSYVMRTRTHARNNMQLN